MSLVTIPYSPRPAQRKLHDELKRYNVVVAHRRFGKTVWALNQAVKSCFTIQRPRLRVAYVAPYRSQAKLIAWDYLKHYSKPVPGVEYNESELRADFPNQSRIQLFGADNPDALRGIYVDVGILDEYADISPSVFSQILRPASVDREGSFIFLGTPKGNNHFHKLYQDAADRPEWARFLLRASETGIIPKRELDALRSEMDEDEFLQEFECSWSALNRGAFYAKVLEQLDTEGKIITVPVDPNYPVHTSWDLGVSDSTSIWFFQIVGAQIRFVDFYQNYGVGIDHYAAELKAKGYTYGQHVAPHDIEVREIGAANAASRKETARNLGINFLVAPKLRLYDGINATRSLLKRSVFDKESCAEGLAALRHYQTEYCEKTKTYKGQPKHDWSSHAADAMRYCAISQDLIREKSDASTPVDWSKYKNQIQTNYDHII